MGLGQSVWKYMGDVAGIPAGISDASRDSFSLTNVKQEPMARR